MLLPIVLVLASAASIPSSDPITTKQALASDRVQALDRLNDSDGFVRKFPKRQVQPDEGIIIPHRDCRPDQDCKTGCLSITAYVFSDGEYPQLQYVTDCPNLDVPYQTKRAHRNGLDPNSQPKMKHTNLQWVSPARNKNAASH